jgi:DNA-binding transcriptional ArsR family regulator
MSRGKVIGLKIDGIKVYSTDDSRSKADFKVEDVEWEGLESFLVASVSAFGHIHRFRIVKFLAESPKSFTEIRKLLEATPPTTNFHLKALVDGTIVFKDENGKYALTLMGELILDYFTCFLKEANRLRNGLEQQEMCINRD